MARAAGDGEFNMYEKMHDAAGARETQGVGLELPSIFIITFIRERRRRRCWLAKCRATGIGTAPCRALTSAARLLI